MRFLICSVVVLVCSALQACSTSPYGRSQLTVPQQVSSVYSEVNMRLQLVVTADAKSKCTESECDATKDFEFRVARLGELLAEKAFELYPDLRERIGHFEFVIADKVEPGTVSNAGGTVVIFSGTRALELSDPALAFVLAREMGHVVARHHDENTATKIIIGVLAQVLFPVTGIIRSLAFIPGASSAAAATATTASATAGGSTAAITATATAASFLGSKAVIATYWPKQLSEADAVALHILARVGFAPQLTADALAAAEKHLEDSSWPRDLRASSEHVAQIAQGPRLDQERVAQILGLAPPKLTYVGENPAAAPTELNPQSLTQ
jgi:predicted Zn-dependent protease